MGTLSRLVSGVLALAKSSKDSYTETKDFGPHADADGHTQATDTTTRANATVMAELPLGDMAEFEDAYRGFIATDDPLVTKAASGKMVWDRPSYDFINGDAPPSVNPSLWRQAKLGLWSATQAMAKELTEHRILVNAVTPGAIINEDRLARFKDGTFGRDEVPEGAVKTREKMQASLTGGGFAQVLTAMMPLGRPGYPDEIAKAVLFLTSDMATYTSGANLIVDGAQSLR